MDTIKYSSSINRLLLYLCDEIWQRH